MDITMEEEPAKEASEWRKLKERLVFNKVLFPLKLTMLLFYGATSLYLPYLTLQMVSVGLSIEEIAIVYAVLPFVTCIVPPLAGALADKFNRYKVFLMALVISTAFFHTMLLHADARLPSSETPSPDWELPAELICDRTGAVLASDNFTCSGNQFSLDNWSATWTPADCLPAPTDNCPTLRMQLCINDNNCTQITPTSTASLEMNFGVAFDESNVAPQNCTAAVVEVQTSQTPYPSDLLCNCLVRCPAMIRISQGPINATAVSQDDLQKHRTGFGSYFIIRIAASSSLAASFSMLDATAICMVKKCRGDLGKQRLFGVIGQAIFAMIAGLLLDWTQELHGHQDYSVLFYFADGLFVVVIILISRLDVDVERVETGNLRAGLRRLIRLVDVDVMMVMMLFLGTCWGFLESFLFVFLMELNASSYLLGMTVTLGCVIGVPFLYISDTIVRKVGSVNVFVISFLLYALRFFGYSFLWNPWLCLPLEALEAVTVHMMAVASSMYCAAAAPPGLLATLNGAVGSVHYSFGRGVGSFAGGILMATYGTRSTFQMYGGFALICGTSYFILHRFWLVKMEQLRLRRKSEHIAEVVASGVEPEDDEPDGRFIIPPDNLMGRRISCF